MTAGPAVPWWMARGAHEVPAEEGWLCAGEAEVLAGIRTAKRRSEYLLRRWTCKHAVAGWSGMAVDLASLARIEVGNHPDGAPWIRVDRTPLEAGVSLSDRAGWAVCVLGAGLGPVGCDIELVEPRSDEFLADFLTPGERRFVSTCGATERDVAANLVWSAKESALKVLRTGLRRDTRSVEVAISVPATLATEDPGGPGWAPLRVQAAEGAVLPGWWRRDGDFVVTVAASHELGPPRPLPGTADLVSARPSHPPLGPARPT